MASAAVMPPTQARTDSPILSSERNSFISSSAASYRTARTDTPVGASRLSLPLSASSSVHTLGPESNNLQLDAANPIHALGRNEIHAQGVHIVKLTDDTVQVESGPLSDSFLQKLTRRLPTNDHADISHIGPPPPSPPASEEELLSVPPPPRLKLTKSEPGRRPLTFQDQRAELQGPSSQAPTPSAGPSQVTRQSSLTTPNRNATRPHPTRVSTLDSLPDSQLIKSDDGLLRPPSLSLHRERPTRRNTTGSSPRSGGSSHASRHQHHGSQPFAFEAESDYMDGELANDIQLHAEQIRRERMSKRAKAQETEAAMTRPKEERALVGNLIGEDHANYVLMYNMLTGIRIGVSRCQAKMKRTLTDEDFTARHKFSFDIVGNELTPSAKYDFKFKDYAPWVFRELREDHFHLDPADYLLSLTAKYILSELGSPGKSGSFFYFSRDYRFIIKTIHHSEHKFLLHILRDYHAHVKSNPHTLLSRFYGLHRVKLPRGRKIHFVIMNNLFPPHRDIHETYDLKGSTVGRLYPEEKAAKNPRAVMKDLNWIDRGRVLDLGPEKRAFLTEQLRRDSEWLKNVRVMDYSLLVGIHNMQRGNKDNVRRTTLKVFSPEMPVSRRRNTQYKGAKSPEAIAMRRAIVGTGAPTSSNITLPDTNACTDDREHFLFYQDEGGLRATGDENENLDTIYYLGIIDILTPWTLFKKAEHLWKGMNADRHKISPVNPAEYGDRFFSFMKAIMRGGGGGSRFKAE